MSSLNDQLVNAAIRYAAMGYPVFPCVPGGKVPLVKRGFKAATTNAGRVERWWAAHPDANIGIPTEGLVVIDIDGACNTWLRNDHGRMADLAKGSISLTPRGGRHCIFRQPVGKNWRNTSGKLADNVDTRANGGYIVVPPSVVGGKAYAWVPGYELKGPLETLSEPPAWLVELLDGGGLPHNASHAATCLPEGKNLAASGDMIPSGQRNAALTSLAGTMRRAGMTADEIRTVLVVVNRNRCQPPLDDREVRRIAQSVARYEPQEDGRNANRRYQPKNGTSAAEFAESAELLSAELGCDEKTNLLLTRDFAGCSDFPLYALPVVLRPFVETGAEAIQCPPDFVAVPLLTALGAVIGRTYVIEVKPGWQEPTALWTVVVGRPGTAKSPALRLATKPLSTLQRKLAEEHAIQMDIYDVEAKHHKKDFKRWERDQKSADNPPAEPEKPVSRRIIVSDATVEALAPIMLDNPRGIILFRDELAGWINSMNQYKGNKGGDVQFFLSTWNGAPVIVDRKSQQGENINIPETYLAVTGSCQPEVLLRTLGRERQEDGFASRLLVCWPKETPRKWVDGGVDVSVTLPVEQLFVKLCKLEMAGEGGDRYPHVLKFSPEGMEAFREVINDHFNQKDLYGLKGPIVAAWAKMEGYLARLALIIQLIRRHSEDGVGDGVDERSVYMAAALSDYFLAHAARLYGMVDEAKVLSLCKRAEEWAEKHRKQQLAGRDIIAARIVADKAQALVVLEQLAASGRWSWDGDGRMRISLNALVSSQQLSRCEKTARPYSALSKLSRRGRKLDLTQQLSNSANSANLVLGRDG